MKIKQTTIRGKRYYTRGKSKYPSVTTILNYYPKGQGFYNWLMNMGTDANIIRDTAANKGTTTHKAVENYLNKIEQTIDDNTTKCLEQFKNWMKDKDIKILGTEKFVINDEIGYAGTIDLILTINDIPYIIDIKTGKSIYTTHLLQLSAYKHTGYEKYKTATLHLKPDKCELAETEDIFDLFLSVKKIYDYEVSH